MNPSSEPAQGDISSLKAQLSELANPLGHAKQVLVKVQVRASLPEWNFLSCTILELRQPLGLILGGDVLVIKPLSVLVTNRLVGG